MKDSFIKGTGNSRYLKSSLDGINSWEDFKAALLAGTLPIDLNGINQTGWQQIGDALNKANLLDDVTQLLIGLSDNEATVNMALRRLVLPAGKYAAVVTVLTPGGRPVPNVTVTGITTAASAACITDANGKAVGFSTSPQVTLSVPAMFIDATIAPLVATLQSGIANTVTMQMIRVSETSRVFNSSGAYRFSPDVDTFDASAIGGGGNGSAGSGKNTDREHGGGGGASGVVVNVANITASNVPIAIIVGGKNGTSSVGTYLTAVGGGDGKSNGDGGVGGARGGQGYIHNNYTNTVIQSATKGGDQSVSFLYPSTSVGGAGGGCRYYSNTGDNRGGAPGGGDGLSQTWSITPDMNPKPGRLPGSGGGGAGAQAQGQESNPAFVGGLGQSGLVGLAWRYK